MCGYVVTFDAHKALFGCNRLECVTMMLFASCIHFPFSTPCDDVLAMLVCATRWLYMHLYTLAYMSMHKSCLLVCSPYFNTMKLCTFDPNLHLSLTDTTFCSFSCLFACFPIMLSMSIMLICFMHFHILFASFLPLLVCWFLVFAFACTHIERRRMELGHDLLGASKKGANASM